MVNSARGEQFPSVAQTMITILEEYAGQWGSMMSAAVGIFDQELIARARLDRSTISLRKGGWVTGEEMDVLTSIGTSSCIVHSVVRSIVCNGGSRDINIVW